MAAANSCEDIYYYNSASRVSKAPEGIGIADAIFTDSSGSFSVNGSVNERLCVLGFF